MSSEATRVIAGMPQTAVRPSADPRPAIAVRGVSKIYKVHDSRRERVLGALIPGRKSGRALAALSDVSFEVARGEAVAIIGRNGSGKSTLLQILTGTLTATEGHVEVNGRVSALLELGSGFNPEYTGRENAILNGLLLGFTRQEMLDRMADIEAFAEIGSAIDQPTKTYSSGMVVRLAFAVQAMSEPDILIVDEALSVGDFFFQQKCFRHIAKLRERGVTLLFVSHDMGAVRDVCERALVLRDSRLIFDGPNLDGIRLYLRGSLSAEERPKISARSSAEPISTSQQTLLSPLWMRAANAPITPARILAVGVYDDETNPATVLRMGSDARFAVDYVVEDGEELHVALEFKNKSGQLVTSTGSYPLGISPASLGPKQRRLFEIQITLSLEAGEYVFRCNLSRISADGQSGVAVDETPWIGPIRTSWDYVSEVPPFYGLVGLPATASFRS